MSQMIYSDEKNEEKITLWNNTFLTGQHSHVEVLSRVVARIWLYTKRKEDTYTKRVHFNVYIIELTVSYTTLLRQMD